MTRTLRRPRVAPPPAHIGPDTTITVSGNKQATVQQQVIASIEAGTHPETAAQTWGLDQASYRRLMTTGAQVRAQHLAGADWYKDFTPDQHTACLFFLEVSKAAKRGEALRRTKLEQFGMGGLVTTRTRQKRQRDDNGVLMVVEEETTTETSAGDPQTLRWLLERESPSIYGQRSQVDLVVDTSDSPQVGSAVAAALEQMTARLAEQGHVIDTTATETKTTRKGKRDAPDEPSA